VGHEGLEPSTNGLRIQRSDHITIGDFGKTGLERDLTSSIARKVILSIAEGKDPKAEDVLLLVNSALNSPLSKYAEAVLNAEPKYVRARLIEPAAMVAQLPQSDFANRGDQPASS